MAVDITSERVAAAAARLHEGGWSFTPRQLYYAVCREVETTPIKVAPGELSIGVLLILVGAITGNRVVLAVLGALGLLLLVVGAVTHFSERRPLPETRVLVTSYDAFVRDHLNGVSFDGMLDPTAAPAVAAANRPVALVCDRAETAALLRANVAKLDVDVDVVDAERIEDLAAATRVVAVHDASPLGCAIAADARDHGFDVSDAGLNPRDLAGERLQLIEGAPARLPRDLSSSLDATEQDWLTRGRRVELATLTPEQVVVRIRAALRAT